LLKDTVESTASIDGSIDRVRPIVPNDFILPSGGLNIRAGDPVLAQEERLQESKRDAMLAFIRANNLNRIITSGGRQPRIGIITVGKSYLDVRQAMDDLGIDEVRANDLGLRLYKIAAPWPLEPQGLREFAQGETIHTEDSHKYTVEGFEALLAQAGWRVRAVWTDPKQWFAVFAAAAD